MRGDGLRWLDALGPQKIRPGLARTRALLDALGAPDRAWRSVLVAGTNGKGSTAATLSALLHAAGVRVGLYTSPHLVDVSERIRIAERDVTDAALDDALALVAAISGVAHPTYFEALTVAGFELFRRARVAVAVVEVGLGGRLDATNVIDPELSIVTNVGLDHTDVLGPTVRDIAREKAGVFRPGRLALTAATGEALEVLRAEAARIGARLVEVAPSSRVPALAGAHQRSNLALALAAAEALASPGEDAIARGLAAVRWPGRLQRVSRGVRRDVLLDGAHNPDGARALAAHLDASGLAGNVDLVFGGLADKELGPMLELLLPRARRAVLTRPDSPRALDPGVLAARASRPGLPVAPLAEALALLDADRSAPPSAPILVTGSLVLVGAALALLRAERADPASP